MTVEVMRERVDDVDLLPSVRSSPVLTTLRTSP